jgi:hypothetical protein
MSLTLLDRSRFLADLYFPDFGEDADIWPLILIYKYFNEKLIQYLFISRTACPQR